MSVKGIVIPLLGSWWVLVWVVGTNLSAQPKVELKPQTEEAFEVYANSIEARFRQELGENEAPLWVRDLEERLLRGEIVVEKVERVPKIPDGLAHDWRGAVFLRRVREESAVALLTDYDRHQEVYPEVVRSRVLARDGASVRGYLRLRKKKVFSVVLDTEHRMQILPRGEALTGLISKSTKIAEVEDPGTPEERVLPIGEDSGFLWRLLAFWGLQERDDGVLLWCRSVSLSRSLPWGVGWVIRPIVESTPKEAFQGTLEATREALAPLPK